MTLGAVQVQAERGVLITVAAFVIALAFDFDFDAY
jgi:hypothetical protein